MIPYFKYSWTVATIFLHHIGYSEMFLLEEMKYAFCSVLWSSQIDLQLHYLETQRSIKVEEFLGDGYIP